MLWQPSPDKSVYNLDNTYHIVRERLAEVDIPRQCHNSGAEFQPPGTVSLKFLNQAYVINPVSADVVIAGSNQPVPLRDKILILHYFTQAKGTALKDSPVTYRDLPGGLVYYPTFVKRTVKSLVDTFGKDARKLLLAGTILGAKPANMGDASLIVSAFARVPVTIVLWQGDEEFAPDLNLLFDASIPDYLESEDITVVCESITWRLVNFAKKS